MTGSSSCEWIIREAELTDIPGIVEVWWEFMRFHANVNPLFTPAPDGRGKFAKHLEEQVVAETSLLLVAESKKAIVGYGLAGMAERPPVLVERAYGMIDDVAVTEEKRGHGFGEALVRATEEWFRERGIHRVELQVVTGNDLASRFWTKMGYETYLEKRYREV
jgi:GNAT superfamily N-acetyltransferase